jgi:hypothetical protein
MTQLSLFAAVQANCGDGGVWGDGVCPLETALLPGAQHVVLPHVWHTPSKVAGRRWYGTEEVVAQWRQYLEGQQQQQQVAS